jgi:hypothetical protein
LPRRLLIAVSVALGLAVVGLYAGLRDQRSASTDPAFFERAIQDFEAQDRATPPEPGAIVFVGSSSIRFWNTLERDMAPLRVLERGFGGAHMAHVVHNADRIVLAYEPSAVVVYAGDNDLAEGSGKTVADVVTGFETLVRLLRQDRPGLPIYFIAIKPSPLRWERWPQMRRANQRIEERAREDPRLTVLDVATPMLEGEGGPPPSALFAEDGLHLSASGYALWADVVRPRLLADLGAPAP